MRTKIVLVVLLGATMTALAASQKVEPLNVKLGLWDMTMTTTPIGQLPIPAEYLSRLTPEQRAKLEERVKAQYNGQAKTRTYKTCLTKEKLEKTGPLDEKDNCATTVLNSTSSRRSLKVQCTNPEFKSSGTVDFEALTPENTKGSGHLTATSGDRTMNIDVTFTGKWLGSACGDVN